MSPDPLDVDTWVWPPLPGTPEYLEANYPLDGLVIDYRPDGLGDRRSVCPACGAPVVTTGTERGRVYIRAAAIADWAGKYTQTEGTHTTIWETYACSADSEHYWGPILRAKP